MSIIILLEAIFIFNNLESLPFTIRSGFVESLWVKSKELTYTYQAGQKKESGSNAIVQGFNLQINSVRLSQSK